MNLQELLLQPLPSNIHSLWLVFDAAFVPVIEDAHDESDKLRVSPVPLNDGRFTLCADLLTEIGEGGAYAKQFARLDPANFQFVDISDSDTMASLWVAPAVDDAG